MSKLSRKALAGPAFFLIALGGCAQLRTDQAGCCGPHPADSPAEAVLPDGPRGAIDPDLNGLPGFSLLDDTLRRERAAVHPYRTLGVADAQCLGAQASPIGSLLDRKAAECMGASGDKCGPCRREVDRLTLVQQEILQDVALEARNRSAGGGLELFYRLAEAEARYDVLRRSIAELDDALAQIKAREAKGMAIGEEFATLHRQRVDALNNNVELELAIDQLNIELQHRLALGPRDSHWRLWPTADWTVIAEGVDIPAAVAVGIEHRPELIMLRRLDQALDARTLPAVRSALGLVHSLAGMECQGGESRCKILLTALGQDKASDEQVQALCRQLHAYRIQREQEVAKEIQEAALTVVARLRQVGVAREAVQTWQARLDELKARSEKGRPTFAERTTAQLKFLEARGALIHQVMTWNIARAHLAEAQGLLAEQCGSAPCPVAPGPVACGP
ncbi:MAG: hypothetical protein JO252_15860 [Planctomycetaceae bacterium]|nr:hypothetical protein [Planctomycetaceae bacterium]